MDEFQVQVTDDINLDFSLDTIDDVILDPTLLSDNGEGTTLTTDNTGPDLTRTSLSDVILLQSDSNISQNEPYKESQIDKECVLSFDQIDNKTIGTNENGENKKGDDTEV